MRYICQVADGWMLVESDSNELKMINTGYPYPNTEKSNFEMVQDLIYDSIGVNVSSNWCRDKYHLLKKYLMFCAENSCEVDVNALYKTMESGTFKPDTHIVSKNIAKEIEQGSIKSVLSSESDGGIYEFAPLSLGMFDCYYVHNIAKIPCQEYMKKLLSGNFAKIAKENGSFVMFCHKNQSIFDNIAQPKYKDIQKALKPTSVAVEAEVSSIFEKCLGLDLRLVIAMISVAEAEACCNVCYELTKSDLSKILVEISKVNAIGGNQYLSDAYAKALTTYVRKVNGVDIAEMCKKVNVLSSAVFSKATQMQIIDKKINIIKQPVTIDVDTFLKYVLIAAREWLNRPLDVNSANFDKYESTLGDSYEGVVCYTVENAARNSTFYDGDDCSFSVGAPQIGTLYLTNPQLKEIVDKAMVGMQPTKTTEKGIIYQLSNYFDAEWANILGFLLHNKISNLSSHSMHSVIDSMYDSEMDDLLNSLFSDLERRIVIDSDGLDKVKNVISFAFLNQDSFASSMKNVSKYVGHSFDLLAELFLNFGDDFFIDGLKWYKDGDTYGVDYKFCFRDGTLTTKKNIVANTTISNKTFETLKTACKLDFVVRLVTEKRVFENGVSFISLDDVKLVFDEKSQRVSLCCTL